MLYSNKLRKIKKGYILLYTIFICGICMCVVLYSFTLELKKARNIESEKNYLLISNKNEEYKEKLLSILYKNMSENIENNSNLEIKKYLKENSIKYYIDNKKGLLKYDEIEDNIIIDSYVDNYYFRRDIYTYDVVDNKLKFKYDKTIYIEGRIE